LDAWCAYSRHSVACHVFASLNAVAVGASVIPLALALALALGPGLGFASVSPWANHM
jgi:hypothetical protein